MRQGTNPKDKASETASGVRKEFERWRKKYKKMQRESRRINR